MNKTERHNLIEDIVRTVRLETQSDLVAALSARGADCTQATVSRDIKELKLAKTLAEDGKYYYAGAGAGGQPQVAPKLLGAFTNGYLGAAYSANIVVVKTITGMAPACALALDAVQWPEVVGTLAGDDTVMVVTKSVSASKKIIKKIEALFTLNK